MAQLTRNWSVRGNARLNVAEVASRGRSSANTPVRRVWVSFPLSIARASSSAMHSSGRNPAPQTLLRQRAQAPILSSFHGWTLRRSGSSRAAAAAGSRLHIITFELELRRD